MSTKPYIVGLTGGIGSGKSTVARAFIDLGIEVVDADHASRKIVERGMPALKFIADRFLLGLAYTSSTQQRNH